ncbi:ATP-binding protein [Longispora albida]|uniref:AAA family ATPase n=1 Tax=Longispora albida TaxID=203523 RepID=UPI00058AC1EC
MRGVARLILLCGLPGSGKTTLAKRLAAQVPAVRLCPDEWLADLHIDLFDEQARDRLEQRFWLLAQDLLRLGQHVILEWGLWVPEHREDKRAAGQALGAEVELYHLDVPVPELNRRLALRNVAGEHGTVPLTPEHIEEYLKYFSAPDAAELARYDRHYVVPGGLSALDLT